MALNALHPLSRYAFIACVRHETASRVLRLYANWYESLGLVVKELKLLSIFGEAAVDEFFGSGVIPVVRQELGSIYD